MSSSTLRYAFIADWNDLPPVVSPDGAMYQRRALSIWPGLDRKRLRRTHGDPWKIAGLVAGRTSLTVEAILVLLMGPEPDAPIRRVAQPDSSHAAP